MNLRVEKNHDLKNKKKLLDFFISIGFFFFFLIWYIDIYISMFIFINSFKHVLFKSIWVFVLIEGT